MLTKFGKDCNAIVHRYPNIVKYWDYMSGAICIPEAVFIREDNVRKEVFELLSNQELSAEYNEIWCMTRKLIGDDNGELIDGVVLTTVEDFC